MVRVRFWAPVFVSFVLATVSAHAQLGPKDGTRLKPTDIGRVKVGNMAPDFALEDMYRKTITLSDFQGKKNVVLVFYRGHW